MQLGMPTLIEMKSIEACAALCQELGLAFIELNMNLPDYQMNRLDSNHLAEIAKQYNLYYTIHLDENLSPGDFNDKVAAAYIATVRQTIETAKQLAVPLLNMHMHPGIRVTLPDQKVYLFEKYEEEYHQKLTAFREACETAIGPAPIKVCLENCGDFGTRPHIQKALALLLESPVFALTFDVGHNATAAYPDEPTIMQHIDKLHHLHLHDAQGPNNHLILGEGNVDIKKYLTMAKNHNCRIVLEVKTVDGLRRSVAWLKSAGCDFNRF